MKVSKSVKTTLIVIGILLIIALIVLFIFHQNGSLWQKVDYKEVKETFTVSGTVESLKKSTLKAPLPGRIISVNFEEGDEIKEGDILAVYDQESYLSQVQVHEGTLQEVQQNYQKMTSGYRKEEIASAKANVENQKTLLEQKLLEYEKIKKDENRKKDLFSKEMLTPKEYEDYIKDLEISKTAYENQKFSVDSAESQYKMLREGYRKEDIRAAKAQIESAKARLQESKTIYDKTEIKAPVSGKITMKSINPGDNVQMGDPLFDIYNKSDLEVKALIEEEDIRNIEMNDPVSIVLDAYPNQTLTGKVISLYDKVEEDTRLLPVKVLITDSNPAINLMPGMTTSCTFQGHKIKYLTVPKKALQRDGKKFYVETKNGKVYLEVGKEHGDIVLVKGNLTTNDEVLAK